MNAWWSEEELTAFQEKNEKLVAYYDSMRPWEGQEFHGSIVTGEACADMGGMKVMLRLPKRRKALIMTGSSAAIHRAGFRRQRFRMYIPALKTSIPWHICASM